MNSNAKEKYSLKFRGSIPWVIAAFAVLSSNWAGDAIMKLLEHYIKSGIWVILLRIGYIVFFAFMVILLWRQRNTFFRPRTRYLSNETAEKRKHLVLFLSNLPKSLEKYNGIPERLTLSQDINEDISVIEKFKESDPPLRWSWEMPLRSIRHHLGTLETVTLICSKESISQAHLFLNICNRYDQIKNITFHMLVQKDNLIELVCLFSPTVIHSFRGFDFESFDELSRAMWFLLREFKRKGYTENEIMIDITGGQKPTSIVGASITFNLKVKAQYVQTNKPWEVLSYDVILASSDTERLGI